MPERIKHVHHHHVRKVPVYIVTKDRPRVMHATHIEDEFEDVGPQYFKRSPGTRARAAADYDDESVIQGVYRGDESHVVHQEIGGVAATSSARPQTEIAVMREQDDDSVRPLHGRRRVPYALGNYDSGRIYSDNFKRPVGDYPSQRHNSWLQSVH